MGSRSIHPAVTAMQRHATSAEAMLKQLANANRLMILCSLVTGKKSVGSLAELVNLSSSAISQHLAKMRDAGLVDCERRGQHVHYRICNMEAQALLSTLHLIYCKD